MPCWHAVRHPSRKSDHKHYTNGLWSQKAQALITWFFYNAQQQLCFLYIFASMKIAFIASTKTHLDLQPNTLFSYCNGRKLCRFLKVIQMYQSKRNLRLQMIFLCAPLKNVYGISHNQMFCQVTVSNHRRFCQSLKR